MESSLTSKLTTSFICPFVFVWLLLSSILELPTLCLGNGHHSLSVNCIEAERTALVAFKEGLTDPSARLSSWSGADCCHWRGIGCNNRTGHVTKLDLRNPTSIPNIGAGAGDEVKYKRSCLGGNISSSLLHLKYLNFLDLSMNDFDGIKIPEFFGMLKNLKYLNLSFASFFGEVPPHLGNLSNLHYLDLNSASYINSSRFGNLRSKNLYWLTRLSSLKHLNLGLVNIDTKADWLQAVNMLPSLMELHLPMCGLESLSSSFVSVNFTSLQTLNMWENLFTSSLAGWLFNLTSLTNLDMSSNCFSGQLPTQLGDLCNLQTLDLSLNDFEGGIHEFLGGSLGCYKNSIVSINLAFNGLVGTLPESLGILENLQHLDLSFNHFWGSVPSSIGNLSSLKILDLSSNKMNGKIPNSFGQLSELVDVNLVANSWKGVLSEDHFMNLKKLKSIKLTTEPSKSLIFNVAYEWVPPFKLELIWLENCMVGPSFPVWLQCQEELTSVTLKNASIIDTIPEEWFSRLASQITCIDLSKNRIKGKLPSQMISPNLDVIDLSSNCFEGLLPLWSTNASVLYLDHNLFSGPLHESIGELMPQLQVLYLSRNHLRGSIPSSICKMKISSNNLIGGVPDEMCNLSALVILNLSMNYLNGSIPKKIGNLRWLETLDLSRNHLSGTIPESLSDLTCLAYLNLSYNSLVGRIPTGNQLQTLNDASIYEGNPSLCGDPLPTKCAGDNTPNRLTLGGGGGFEDNKDENNFEMIWLKVSIGFGFVVGFCGVCGTLLLKQSWMDAYFQ